MNFKLNKFLIKQLAFIAIILSTVFACQDEITDVTPPNEQETITENSVLANLIGNTSALDGSTDNIIDNANCILINLPVTIMVNGVEIVIDSVEDYEVIEAIFDEFDTDEDDIEILFPITITLNDYTQIEITNYTELEVFIAECSGENEDDDDIECIDFQYPITFSIYDSNFQLTETVTIENDEALYNFIENLEGGVLASLNFPVTMILSDGSTVAVNSNQELEVVITEAQDDCDEDDDNDWDDDDYDCTEENIVSNLLECYWVIVAYNGNDTYIQYNVEFHENGSFEMHEGFATSAIGGAWEMSISANGLPELVITQLTAFQDTLIGSWIIVECDDDRLELINVNDTMVMEQDCTTNNLFECFESFDPVVVGCDDNNNGFAVFNLPVVFDNCLNPNELVVTYHETQVDADTNTNAIANPQAYVSITTPPNDIYARVEIISTGIFEVFEVTLLLENCNPSGCNELAVDDYLQTCIWNVVNYNGSNDLITYDLDFQENGVLIINGNGQTITSTWSTSETNDGVWVEFDGVNGANIQAISGNWLVVECDPDRLQMNQGSTTMVMEQDCTNAGECDVNEAETNLMDCEWTISSYNNDSGFNIFNINFMENNNATITSSNENYTANWIISLDGNIYLDFSNISGGNVQVLEGNFILVECTPNQMVFHDPSNTSIELVLDKVCN